MSEEENQAFKKLCFYNPEDYGTEELKKCIKIIVNLVDKQQKEIEELKHDNSILCETAYTGKRIQLPYTMVYTGTDNFISKDKIKEKIDLIDKEYAEFIEKNKNDLYLVNINAQRHSAMQSILEELLGE